MLSTSMFFGPLFLRTLCAVVVVALVGTNLSPGIPLDHLGVKHHQLGEGSTSLLGVPLPPEKTELRGRDHTSPTSILHNTVDLRPSHVLLHARLQEMVGTERFSSSLIVSQITSSYF